MDIGRKKIREELTIVLTKLERHLLNNKTAWTTSNWFVNIKLFSKTHEATKIAQRLPASLELFSNCLIGFLNDSKLETYLEWTKIKGFWIPFNLRLFGLTVYKTSLTKLTKLCLLTGTCCPRGQLFVWSK